MFVPTSTKTRSATQELEYVLRRAEEETIAQIRSGDAEVGARHAAMARAYGARAQNLMASHFAS